MGQEASEAIEIRDFPGIDANIDALDTTPGVSESQVNATCGRTGSLTVRGGLARVTFEDET